MRDLNAATVLAKVMNWEETGSVLETAPGLQLLADYKYDHYQRFSPGQRFIESLALWLNQFDAADRKAALDFIKTSLIYISDREFSHLVSIAYPDLIFQELMRLVAEEIGLPTHRVGRLASHRRSLELQLKSLYLGLSDGARTNELRRESSDRIGNEQIWQAYELGEQKSKDMLKDLGKSLNKSGFDGTDAKFNLIWLVDDFSGSGNTYIRYDHDEKRFKGKLGKIYDQIHRDGLVDPSHYEVFLLLYVATRQSIDHIEYWCGRFTSENGYKPLQIRVLCPLEPQLSILKGGNPVLKALLDTAKYFDVKANDDHMKVGGADGRYGFANCALPVVLSHNSPNNSVYVLWGPEHFGFTGLFPRVSRHKEA